jgi:hypothetical protein
METYEYYAFRFLSQWHENEFALYMAISAKPEEAQVRKALSYFQVSRNFKGIDKPGNLTFIVQSLQAVCCNLSLSAPVVKVNKLASVFKSRFGQLNVSAASKLLWLSYRCPYIICDSRATKALKKEFHHRRADESYEEYVDAWRSEFTNHKKQIEDAANALPRARLGD